MHKIPSGFLYNVYVKISHIEFYQISIILWCTKKSIYTWSNVLVIMGQSAECQNSWQVPGKLSDAEFFKYFSNGLGAGTVSQTDRRA
jgi:hypothetical protein